MRNNISNIDNSIPKEIKKLMEGLDEISSNLSCIIGSYLHNRLTNVFYDDECEILVESKLDKVKDFLKGRYILLEEKDNYIKIKDNEEVIRIIIVDNIENYIDNEIFDFMTIYYNLKDGIIDKNHCLKNINQGWCDIIINDPNITLADKIKETPYLILQMLIILTKFDYLLTDEDYDLFYVNRFLLKLIPTDILGRCLEEIITGKFIHSIKRYNGYDDILASIDSELKGRVDDKIINDMTNSPPNKEIRWALFLQNVNSEKLDVLLYRLGINKDKRKIIKNLIKYKDHLHEMEITETNIIKIIGRLGFHNFLKLLDIYKSKYSRIKDSPSRLDKIYNIIENIVNNNKIINKTDLLITEDDLRELGYNNDNKIEKAMFFLLDSIIDGKIENEKESLLMWLQINEAIKDF